VRGWPLPVQAREANSLGRGDSASWIYTNTQGSNPVDFRYTLQLNAPNGTVSFQLSPSKSNIARPPLDALHIEASSRTYELTYRQPIVQNPRREIAIGISVRRGERETSLLGKDVPLSLLADAGGRTRVAALRLFQDFTQRREVLAVRSQFTLGVGAFGATVSSSDPETQFLTGAVNCSTWVVGSQEADAGAIGGAVGWR
jgi:hemolysin activation/secretion protein